MKTAIQSFLKSIGIYDRVKSSFLYDAYWRVAKPALIRQRNADVERYRSFGIERGDLIFDIGANHGVMTDIFLRLGARVVAVEPDAFCQGVIKRRFHMWRFKKKPVEIVGCAVSDKRGFAGFHVSETEPGCAKNTLSEKWANNLATSDRFGEPVMLDRVETVPTETLDSLIARFGSPKFIKIDVEGYELLALSGLSQIVPIIQFEINLPEFIEDGVACVEKLCSLHKRCRFNVGDSNWLTETEVISLIRTTPKKSLDVVCRKD